MDPEALPAPLAAALLDAGYRVGGPAGVGARGPAWTVTRAGAAASGRPERLVAQHVAVPDGDARLRLAGRLETLWELDNPHLPEVVDVVVVPPGDDGAEGWVVLLEEVPGATVGALLAARGRLSPGEVVTLAVPVAGALDALHRAGVVHGDVSPANLVVRPDGRPVLIDVLGGSAPPAGARRSGRDASTGSGGRGTPGFTAPEVAARRLDPAGGVAPDGLAAGAPADVYALAGVALAALDLGAHGGRLGAELRAACATDPVRRPTAAELAAAMYACADPEPIGQPDAGVLARAELAQLAAPPRTVSVPRGGRHRAGGRRGRLRRRLVIAALSTAVSTVVAVGGIAWTVVQRPVAAPEGMSLGPAVAPAEVRARPGAAAVPAQRPDDAAGAVDGVDGGDRESPAEPMDARDPGEPVDGGGSGDPGDPGGLGDPGDPGEPVEAGDAADPVQAAQELTRLRAEVLDAGDPARLTEVSVPDSPAHRADRALLERLAAAGATLDGLTADVESAVVDGAVQKAPVEEAPATPGPPSGAGTSGPAPDPGAQAHRTTVDVRVRSTMTGHVRRTASGASVVPAQPSRTVVLRLAWTDAGWRVSEVRPVPGRPAPTG